MIAQVTLVGTKFGVHDCAGLQYGHSAVDNGGICDKNLEEWGVGGMKSIEVDALHEDDGAYELGIGGGGVAFDRERDGVIQG